jgi:ABC-2 type transport system ATP-binding protein
MEDGADLVSGTPLELTQRFWPGTVVLIAAEEPTALAGIKAIPGVRDVEAGDLPGSLRVQLDDERRVPDVILALAAGGARLTRVEPIQPTLEDLYFAVRTKKQVAADGGRQLDSDDVAGVLAGRNRQVEALTGWEQSPGHQSVDTDPEPEKVAP